MSLGRQVSRLAVGDATMMVAPVLYGIDGSLKQRDRASEDLPFGARGVTRPPLVPARRRVHRPASAEADAERIHPRPRPSRRSRSTSGSTAQRVKLFDQAGLMKGTPPAEGYTQDDLGDPECEKNSLDGDCGASRRASSPRPAAHVLALALPARRWDADESFVLPAGAGRDEERDGNIAIKTVEIGGPFGAEAAGGDRQPQEDLHAAARRPKPSSSRCATTILSTHRAPRVSPAGERRRGADADAVLPRRPVDAASTAASRAGIERILASPHFLFRVRDAWPTADASASRHARLRRCRRQPEASCCVRAGRTRQPHRR